MPINGRKTTRSPARKSPSKKTPAKKAAAKKTARRKTPDKPTNGIDWKLEVHRQRAIMIRQERLEKARHLIRIDEIRELHLRLLNLFRVVQREAMKRLNHDDAVMIAELFNEKLEDIRRRVDDFGIPWQSKKRGRGPDKKRRTRAYASRSAQTR